MVRTEKISLFAALMLTMITVTFLAVAAVGSLWLSSLVAAHLREVQSERESYIDGVKAQLQHEVDRAIQYIELRQSLVEGQVRQDLRDRAGEAVGVAENLVRTYHDRLDGAALQKLVYDALRPMRFDAGLGYVFAIDMQGVNHIDGDRREVEGTNVLESPDPDARNAARQIIDVARQSGEGFCEYLWTRPGAPGSERFHKITYVKRFAPFDWAIGVGEYQEDVQQDVQAEVADRLERLRFGKDGYVFAGREDGTSMTAPARGRNMLEETDANGVKIVQELIRRAKAGGGFVQYVMPAIGGKRSSPKLSYARWLPSWRWYVGAGVYIDEIDSAIAEQDRELRRKLLAQLGTTLSVLAVLLLVAGLAARLIAGDMRRSFDAFTRFFEAAATGNPPIPESQVKFREFSRLAEYARRMIDERGRTEEEKARLQDQLRQSQKMEAVGQLAGGVAHDFNNLLTIISGNTELTLSDPRLPVELKANVEEIKRAAVGASSLTRQLLAFSRRQVMELQSVDLNGLLTGIEEMLRRVIGEDIQLEVTPAPGLGNIRADPGQIQAAIVNLALNARDAMPGGGRLTIQTAAGNDRCCDEGDPDSADAAGFVRLIISDTGVGMTADVQARIFEPFFTTKERGTGLGLAMVYGIVKQSKGHVTVSSSPGKGSTFTLCLPREVRPERSPPGPAVAAPARAATRQEHTILLVEDEPEVRDLIVRALRGQGYHVLHAADGKEGLAVMRSLGATVDLVVTDVVMPVMNGPQMVKEIRTLQPGVRVLFISGYAHDAAQGPDFLDHGATLIQKPFDLADLAARVHQIIARPISGP